MTECNTWKKTVLNVLISAKEKIEAVEHFHVNTVRIAIREATGDNWIDTALASIAVSNAWYFPKDKQAALNDFDQAITKYLNETVSF